MFLAFLLKLSCCEDRVNCPSVLSGQTIHMKSQYLFSLKKKKKKKKKKPKKKKKKNIKFRISSASNFIWRFKVKVDQTLCQGNQTSCLPCKKGRNLKTWIGYTKSVNFRISLFQCFTGTLRAKRLSQETLSWHRRRRAPEKSSCILTARRFQLWRLPRQST